MALPTIQELMRPVLEAHLGGAEMRASDLIPLLVPVFSITDEELSQRQTSGDGILAQRLGWARDNLVQTGLLERPASGLTKITPEGRRVAESGEAVTGRRGDWAASPISREAVLAAMEEFDREGRDTTLQRHGFRRALDYMVVHGGREYDAKGLYGVAHAIQYPDEAPLRTRGFQGGVEVNSKLAALGFAVVSRKASVEPPDISGEATGVRVWVIRAGREGQHEQLALDQGVCLIGWSALGPISPTETRDDLKRRLYDQWGETRQMSLAVQAGQIFRFIHDVSIGDLVVLPLRSSPGQVAIGRVTGEYAHRSDGAFENTDAQHTRSVDWLARGLPYERFDPDLREAFGQQGTVSEISKPNASQRIIDVVGGADASAIHLVLKWSAARDPETVVKHLRVVDEHGASWWGRESQPGGPTGLAEHWLEKLRKQLDGGSTTYVFLHSAGSTWRTRLVAVTTDTDEIEADLRPPDANPAAHHSLWVKLTEFEEVEPSEITEGFVLAQSGGPVTPGGLGNQTPLIIRAVGGALPGRYFIIELDSDPAEEVHVFRWGEETSGPARQLANSPGARVIVRTGGAGPGGPRFVGSARIAHAATELIEGVRAFAAAIDDFVPFTTSVSLDLAPPQALEQSIHAISKVQFDKIVEAGVGPVVAGELSLEMIRESAVGRGLNLPEIVYVQVLAALSSGKHVILTGPPGTAKTTLAQAVAEAARASGRSEGYVLTTATADWTTYETIGGLRPAGPDELQFEEGHFLRAIRDGHWLVIDELNRSHFDRAFGQLFTVLSGQPVVLPYRRPGQGGDLALVPEGVEPPGPGLDVLTIPQAWRVIATMNVFDKTLLFEMSFALMRRFAFIEVASPSPAVFEALIGQASTGDSRAGALAQRLLDLRSIKDLGPAVFMDLAKYLRTRIALKDADDGQLLFEAFYAYLLPQFEGIDAETGDRLFAALGKLMGSSALKERLRVTLNAVLGLELSSSASPDVGHADDEEGVEQPEP